MALTLWKFKNLYANEKYQPQRTFYFEDKKIVIHQSLEHEICLERNTGNIVWDSAFLLAHFLLKKQKQLIGQTQEQTEKRVTANSSLYNKNILELGSGTGFLSLVLAKCFCGPLHEDGACQKIENDDDDQESKRHSGYPKKIYCTDLPEQLGLIELNMRENNVSFERIVSDHPQLISVDNDTTITNNHEETMTINPLVWGDALPSCLNQTKIDIVVASEIFYLKDTHLCLLKTLKRLRANSPSLTCYFSYKFRNLNENEFFDLLSMAGFHVKYIIDPTLIHEEFVNDSEYKLVQVN